VTVVLDTNALMMPVECDIRLFEELDRLLGESREQVVPQSVVTELADLATGAGKTATAASVAADLARRRCTAHETDAVYADDAVVELATAAVAAPATECEPTGSASGAMSCAVTNDRPLRERLLDRGVPVISLRGENKLTVTEP
jgi:SSU processome protein Utp24